ncbi:MAG: DNA primase [Steroidobacteraceae bacterium]
MAGRIPQSFIDELIARTDIVEAIGARVSLKKSGREFKACCPFHAEKTPSFWVSPDKQFYHCFGCGAHGTVLGFLMQYEKLSFVEAVEDLAQRAGLELPREARDSRQSAPGADLHQVLGDAAQFFAQNLQDSQRAHDYATKRGIEPYTAKKFLLGYATDSWNALLNRFGQDVEGRHRLLQTGLIIERERKDSEREPGHYDRFRDRLMFPIRDARGRVIAFGGRVLDQGEPKYLNSPETALFHKGRELYGLYEARQARSDFRRLMIVEGYMDVVRLHQAGITYAVATLGTATTQEHLNKIFRLTSEVVFCFDGDRAGRQAAWRALENALPLARDGRELKFLFLPEGQDPDSLVGEEGQEAFEARLANALPLSEYLVQQLVQQTDLSHADGRAKLAALAKPLFARMPDGVLKELVVDQLATEIRMPAGKLRQLLEAGTPERDPSQAREASNARGGASVGARPAVLRRPGERMRAGRGNMLSQAISLVLHHPAAAQALDHPGALETLDRPGIPVLRKLIGQAREAHTPSTATLLERWRDEPEFERLAQIAAETPLVPDAAAAARELNMAVQKLAESLGPGRRMDELLRKAEETGLNSEEKAELSLLLKARVQGAASQ